MCDLLAEKFKGGGHKNASSFTMDRTYFFGMIEGNQQNFQRKKQ
jgi:nanoRNase/pAp phosphatase (c-di-AMP/oligoRNAs hydrolase)